MKVVGDGEHGNEHGVFNKDTEMLISKFTPSMIREFNFDNTTNFWKQVLLNRNGEINTWAIYWYATIFK
jgi:hypothetical protein